MNNCYECLHHDVCIKWKKPTLYGVKREEGCVDHFMSKAADEVVYARWEAVQNGSGCCSNCHRLDSIDNLATHCRYCGAKMRR
jgi:hypothetical protein